jgi:hypothetical protein
MQDEPLSLGTFEPSHALEPYLNTPRSLEACKRHGVNPVELVEIPFDEFRKAFPTDADAAQRRYERIDGARRRLLKNVVGEWDHICETGWSAGTRAIDKSRESIIIVDPRHHSTMLERQAEKFRSIEKLQWEQMQRMVGIELSNAVRKQANDEILVKQAQAGDALDNQKAEMQAKKAELFEANVQRKREEERQKELETKRLQKAELIEANAMKRKKEQQAYEDRMIRERREAERRQREEYTKELKDSIIENFNQNLDAKVADAARKDKERTGRINEFKNQAAYEKAKKRKVVEDRMKASQKHLTYLSTGRSDERRQKIEEEEAHWQKKKQKEAEDAKSRKAGNDEAVQQKLAAIRKAKNDAAAEKVQRTLASLELKEAIFKTEQAKIEGQKERRKNIKMIRQEAFELSAQRRKKANDYKFAQLQSEIERKDGRYDAMKEGRETLNHMRHVMAEIMEKTKLELKDGINELNHKGMISPDKVVSKVFEVSSNTMFPHLAQKFVVETVRNDDADLEDEMASQTDSMGRPLTAPTQKKDSNLGFTGDDLGASIKKPGSSRAASREKSTHLALKVLAPQVVAKDVIVKRGQVVDGIPRELINGVTQPAKARGPDKQAMTASIMRQQMQSTIEETTVQMDRLVSSSRSLASHPEDGEDAASRGSRSRGGMSGTARTAAEPGTIRLQRPVGGSMAKYDSATGDVAGLFDDASVGGVSSKSGRAEAEFDRAPTNSMPMSMSMGPSLEAVYDEARGANHSKKGPDGRELKTKKGEFRREYSEDHPLAAGATGRGGTGKYSAEKRTGKRAVGAGAALDAVRASKARPVERLAMSIDSADMRSPNQAVDMRTRVELLRKEQNQVLLKVLDEERKFEEDRSRAGKMAGDKNERNRLELVFAEERRRASERIVGLTKEHERKLKEAVVTMK